MSEIVGFDAVIGNKVGSRIDPLQIDKVSPDDRVFNVDKKLWPDEDLWTDDPKKASKDKNDNLELASRGSDSGEAGQPSKNQPRQHPSNDRHEIWGVTISKAVQTTVLSFAALRKLHFKNHSREAENAARVAVAALGITAMAYQHKADFDLRSRCLLVPTEPPRMEMLSRSGSSKKT